MKVDRGAALKLAIIATLSSAQSVAMAQSAEGKGGAMVGLEEVVVSGSRLPAEVSSMPISINILDERDISRQLDVTDSLQDILANLVPGLSLGSQATIATYMSLRGRKPVFLVDGVPVTSTLNDVARESELIDPAAIERIEVVRGSSALYGNSAGAGFINYITKQGSPGQLAADAELGTAFSLTHTGDSQRPTIRAGASGGSGGFDFLVRGYYEQTNSFFDADGERIPPQPDGLSDSTMRGGFAKLGYSWDDRRLEGSVSYYKHEQEAEYQLVPGNIAEGIPTSTVEGGLQPGEVPRSNESLVANLVLTDQDVMGTSLRAQLYYVDSESVFQFVKNRFPLTDQPDGQSANDTEKLGVRLDLNTPLPSLGAGGGTLLWGLDYINDDTQVPLVDGRDFGIPQELKSYAAFFQLHSQVTERLSLTGGVRFEKADLEIKDFLSLFTLHTVTGGTLEYSTQPLNLGGVFSINDRYDWFFGWSQGFEVQQLSFLWRATPVDVVIDSQNPKPNIVDSYETGLRYNNGDVRWTAAVFYVENSNGVSLVFNPAIPNDATPVRAPDRVYGAEAEFEWQVSDAIRVGGSAAWLEGEADMNDDGSFETSLQNRRIPPPKVTAFVDWRATERLDLRMQGIYWGSRDEFPNSTTSQRFHEGKINSGGTVDLVGTYAFDSSQLSVGISNLFNRDYYTNYSEGFNRNDAYNKAYGATAFVKYKVWF